jgi:hypothetical protein
MCLIRISSLLKKIFICRDRVDELIPELKMLQILVLQKLTPHKLYVKTFLIRINFRMKHIFLRETDQMNICQN